MRKSGKRGGEGQEDGGGAMGLTVVDLSLWFT
jgi:hypothetical protein